MRVTGTAAVSGYLRAPASGRADGEERAMTTVIRFAWAVLRLLGCRAGAPPVIVVLPPSAR